MKTIAALLLVLAAGLGAIYQGTDGFQALTTEDARRLAIARQARPLPPATIQLASGQQQPLSQVLRADGRVAIVNFIYTRCKAICSVMGTEFQQLQRELQAAGMAHQVRLLSISFDPTDQAAQLAAYARQMQAQAELWQFAGVPDARQRQALLAAFGITVVAATLGEFEHNAAFHIVDANGQLVQIVNYDQPQLALQQALAIARRSTGGAQPPLAAVRP